VGSSHGRGRRAHSGGLRIMLEEEEHQGQRAQENGGEMAVEKVL
jgi:hypothetical protein